jgi:hypothetical protein
MLSGGGQKLDFDHLRYKGNPVAAISCESTNRSFDCAPNTPTMSRAASLKWTVPMMGENTECYM